MAKDHSTPGDARRRSVVDQATGWLAGRLDCDINEAAEHLGDLARQAGGTVAETAALLLGGGAMAAVPSLIPPQPDRGGQPGRRRPDLVPLTAVHARIEAERREATLRMQQAILPTPEHRFQGGRYDIAVRYEPAQSDSRAGGDWYEVRDSADGGVLVTIGDVAGHGLTAAAAMARIGNALRGLTITGQPPDTLLRWLNDLVCADEIPERVVSAAVGEFGQDPPRIRWAQAGHPPPVLIRDSEPRLLARPVGLLLGTVRGTEYELTATGLRPGDRLVFYTDGLIERRDRDIDVGLAELLKTAASYQAAPAEEIAAGLAARLSPGGDDDVCVLAISVG